MTTYPVTIPTLPLVGLSDDEIALFEQLQEAATLCRTGLEMSEAYYLGEQIVKNLRIAIPKELEFLNTVVGWGAVPVDPLVERLSVDGFLLPGATDADDYVGTLWDAAGMEAEQALAFTDMLSMGRTYGWVGKGEDAPRITIESPLNMTVLWSLDGTTPRAALQAYRNEDRSEHATLLLPFQTIELAKDERESWQVVSRDQHKFGFVPVVRIANRARTTNRDGRSEISAPMRSTIDSACRDLLGLEVSRELYSVPQKVILGATEADFVNADGTPKRGWDTYINKILGLERDEEGNLPEIKQLQPFSPAVFLDIKNSRAADFAGYAAATPQDLGLYTEGNPVSADAQEQADTRKNDRARLKQRMSGTPLVQLMQHAIRFDNGGDLPKQYRRMAVDWAAMRPPSLSLVSDGLSKQVSAGMVPATSDVTLRKAGYTAVERRRLAQDRADQATATASQQFVDALNNHNAAPQAAQGTPDGNPVAS